MERAFLPTPAHTSMHPAIHRKEINEVTDDLARKDSKHDVGKRKMKEELEKELLSTLKPEKDTWLNIAQEIRSNFLERRDTLRHAEAKMTILDEKVQRLRTKASRIRLLQNRLASMGIQTDEDEDVMKRRMVVSDARRKACLLVGKKHHDETGWAPFFQTFTEDDWVKACVTTPDLKLSLQSGTVGMTGTNRTAHVTSLEEKAASISKLCHSQDVDEMEEYEGLKDVFLYAYGAKVDDYLSTEQVSLSPMGRNRNPPLSPTVAVLASQPRPSRKQVRF